MADSWRLGFRRCSGVASKAYALSLVSPWHIGIDNGLKVLVPNFPVQFFYHAPR